MEGRILACADSSISRDCYSKARRRAESAVHRAKRLSVVFTEIGQVIGQDPALLSIPRHTPNQYEVRLDEV